MVKIGKLCSLSALLIFFLSSLALAATVSARFEQDSVRPGEPISFVISVSSEGDTEVKLPDALPSQGGLTLQEGPIKGQLNEAP
jgi:hypothetical protein